MNAWMQIGASYILDIEGALGSQRLQRLPPSAAARLMHVPSGRWLLDVTSPWFNRLMEVGARLDDTRFIHVLVAPQATAPPPPWLELRASLTSQAALLATVDMTRRQLLLELVKAGPEKESAELRPVQHGGYVVAASHLQGSSLGTLTGLQRGLLVYQPTSASKRLLLVPHGDLHITRSNSSSSIDRDTLLGLHQVVDIVCNTNPKCVKEPPIFPFEIDVRLRHLRAPPSRLAWVYLAYLHAAAAGPFPDRLTGMQGTEAAMHVLQSPRCASTEPVSRDAHLLSHLHGLLALAPHREFVSVDPRGKENVYEK
jgi:hypothetical protein